MTISFYMDVHIRRAITDELRRAGVDVLTAQEDGCAELTDPQLLDPFKAAQMVGVQHNHSPAASG